MYCAQCANPLCVGFQENCCSLLHMCIMLKEIDKILEEGCCTQAGGARGIGQGVAARCSAEAV